MSKKLCLQLNLHTHFKTQLMRYRQHVGDRPTCFCNSIPAEFSLGSNPVTWSEFDQRVSNLARLDYSPICILLWVYKYNLRITLTVLASGKPFTSNMDLKHTWMYALCSVLGWCNNWCFLTKRVMPSHLLLITSVCNISFGSALNLYTENTCWIFTTICCCNFS